MTLSGRYQAISGEATVCATRPTTQPTETTAASAAGAPELVRRSCSPRQPPSPARWPSCSYSSRFGTPAVVVVVMAAVGDRRQGMVAWGCVAGLLVAVVADSAPSTAGVAARVLAAAAEEGASSGVRGP
jgi:hypothetical protein